MFRRIGGCIAWHIHSIPGVWEAWRGIAVCIGIRSIYMILFRCPGHEVGAYARPMLGQVLRKYVRITIPASSTYDFFGFGPLPEVSEEASNSEKAAW